MTPTQDDIAAIARVTGWVAFQQYTGDVLLIDDLSCMEPWSTDADAIAALKAWRERKPERREFRINVDNRSCEVVIGEDHKLPGIGIVDWFTDAATLPAAACAALIEADRRERNG